MEEIPPYEIIAENLKNGRVIPFLGAGASLGTRTKDQKWTSPEDLFLPNGDELAAYLHKKGKFPEQDIADLPRVAQYLDGVLGRQGLNDQLHPIFSKAYQPTPLHTFLASVPSNLLIVTTNYDDLLERAFLNVDPSKPFDLVIYNTAKETVLYRKHGGHDLEEVLPNELVVDLEQVSVIFKMHGTFYQDSEQDRYVVTEDDYVEFLSRMSQRLAIPTAFGKPFRKSHFLFLGYGLRDWNLRVILHRIWKERMREGQNERNSWAVLDEVSFLERKFWSGRNLTIFQLAIENFLHNLKQVME